MIGGNDREERNVFTLTFACLDAAEVNARSLLRAISLRLRAGQAEDLKMGQKREGSGEGDNKERK